MLCLGTIHILCYISNLHILCSLTPGMMGSLSSLFYLSTFSLLGSCLFIPLLINHIRDSSSFVATVAAGQRSSNTAILRRNMDSAKLDLAFVNNLPGTPQLFAYVTGHDTSGALVMLQSNDQWYHPSSRGSSTPVKITTDARFTLKQGDLKTLASLPDYISSSRIYISKEALTFATSGDIPSLVEPSAFDSQDPNVNVSYGFVELDYGKEVGVFDISYVDWVGLPLGIAVMDSNGKNQSILGLHGSAVHAICHDLKLQTQMDGLPWHELCRNDTNDSLLRVWSPAQYVAGYPNTTFEDYFTTYLHEVWAHYTTHALTFVTASSATGNVTCKVDFSTDLLTCAGDNRGYAKPSCARDIFGCSSGPFALTPEDNAVHRAVVPRLCAALNRGTLLLPGGHLQPSAAVSEDDFYPAKFPSNQYARIVHKWEQDGKGYAFSYDDVCVGDSDPAGLISVTEPVLLTVTIGGSKG